VFLISKKSSARSKKARFLSESSVLKWKQYEMTESLMNESGLSLREALNLP
jgi:hypothetical protein